MMHGVLKVGKKNRSIHSLKIKTFGARCLSWVDPSGLCFKYTTLFGARVSEKKLNQLLGKLGNECLPLEE